MVIPGADSVQFTGRVPVIHLEGRLPVLDTPMVQSLGLRDGQVVRPTVEVRDGQVTLMLHGQAIPVPPQLRLAAGERPWWQVSVDARGRGAGDYSAAASPSSALPLVRRRGPLPQPRPGRARPFAPGPRPRGSCRW